MSVLHDHPLLGSEEIKKATETNVAGSNLHEQIERVRITPHPLSLEEMSKMWTMFQTQYRISAAYEVSVVLIESTLPTRAALPVLTRGKDDAGVQTLLGESPLLSEVHVPLTGKFDPSIVTPTAQGIQLVKALPSAQPGDELALLGQRLAGDYVRVVFERQRTGETFEPNIVKRSAEAIIVKLPGSGEPAAANLTAGFLLATVITRHASEPERHSDSLQRSHLPQGSSRSMQKICPLRHWSVLTAPPLPMGWETQPWRSRAARISCPNKRPCCCWVTGLYPRSRTRRKPINGRVHRQEDRGRNVSLALTSGRR